MSCIERCPHFMGKFLLRKYIWDIAQCPEVSLFQGCPLRGVPFYVTAASHIWLYDRNLRYVYFHTLYYLLGVTVGFEQTVYTTTERTDPSVELCANLTSGTLERTVNVLLSTSDGTATFTGLLLSVQHHH